MANTAAPPVNCDSVDILFSDVQFEDFPGMALILDTPNDGSETITAPLSDTESGRIMVLCHSNIFFDINDAPITNEIICGNLMLDNGEQCDDGNIDIGDGCSASCQVEQGWICHTSPPSLCVTEDLFENGFEDIDDP